MTRLRTYFLTGLIITAPIGITVYLTWSFVEWVDGWVKPYIPTVYNPDNYLPFAVPGFGLLFALLVITIIGFFTASFFGRTVIGFGERLVNQMPFVGNVYKALKQIFETVLSERGNSFEEAVLVEYPRRGIWALAFVATDARGEIVEKLDRDDLIAVFLPTTPNPTSGFLLFVPKEDVRPLEMSIEDAAKLVISSGLVVPGVDNEIIDAASDDHSSGT